MELFATIDDTEQRIEARAFVASYLVIDDAIIGLVESEIEGMEWESEEAKEQAYADHYSDYGADEVYEAITGEKVPDCAYAYYHEGDLFIGMYEDCDTDDAESIREVFDDMQNLANEYDISIEWMMADDANRAALVRKVSNNA